MRLSSFPLIRPLLLLLAGLETGCGTLSPSSPSAPLPAPQTEVGPLSEENRVFAQVLARYAQGLIHESRREYDFALANYLEAVSLDPANQELNFRIVMGLLRQRRTEEALRIIKEVTERNPRSEKALAWLALVYRASDQPEKAREAYERLVKIDPSREPPYLDYASFHLQQGNPQAAKDLLVSSARKVKNPLDMYRVLANILIDEASRAASPEEAFTAREEAITWYEKAARIAGDNLEVRLQLGDLMILNERHEEAMQQFRAAEKLAPDDLGLKRQLALRFLAVGDNEQAIKTLEAISEEQPTNTQVYYYLGELYSQDEQPERARLNFSLAATASKKDPLPYIRLAMLQMEETPAEALETLSKGLEKMPRNPRLSEAMAHAYLETEEYERAVEWFARAAERLPAELINGRFHFNYANALFLSGRRAEARGALGQAADESPLFLQLFMHERITTLDLDAVIAFFSSYAELRPEDPAAYLVLGMLKSFSERFEEAIADFSRTLELAQADPELQAILDDEFYFAYAAAHERTQQIRKAERYFLKVLDLNPEHANAHNYLAYMWAERGAKLDRALDHVRTALGLNPDNGAFLDTLGWVYYMQGAYEDALHEVQRANEKEPADPTIADHLGDILAELDRPEEALAQWKRSFLLDPENEAVAEKLTARGIDLDPLRDEARTLATAKEAEQDPEAAPLKAGPLRTETAVDLINPPDALNLPEAVAPAPGDAGETPDAPGAGLPDSLDGGPGDPGPDAEKPLLQPQDLPSTVP